MFYPKGTLLVIGADIQNNVDPERPLITVAYGESVINGEKKYLTERMYKDVFEGIRSGDYELYYSPWSRKTVVFYENSIIEHRPQRQSNDDNNNS